MKKTQQTLLNDLREVVSDFFMREYEYSEIEAVESVEELTLTTEDFSIAYTELEGATIEAFINLTTTASIDVVLTLPTGVKIKREINFEGSNEKNLENLIEFMKGIDFDSLISFEFDVEEIVNDSEQIAAFH